MRFVMPLVAVTAPPSSVPASKEAQVRRDDRQIKVEGSVDSYLQGRGSWHFLGQRVLLGQPPPKDVDPFQLPA